MTVIRPSLRGTPLKALVVALLALLALSVPQRALAQDLIALRSSASIETNTPIRLDQIADISGPGAERLSAVVLDPSELSQDKQGWIAIDLERVRSTLEKLGTENWGRLTLRGSTCNVRRVSPAPAPSLTPQAPAPTPAQGPTVREAILSRLTQVFDVAPEALKLVFDESDSKLLNTPTTGLIADVQLVGASERQPLSVRLYKDLATVANGQVRVNVNIKRRVALATGGARRGQALDESAFITEERWVGPTVRPADPDAVLGQFARGRIGAGQVIEVTDVEPPVVIKKGELADVVCLSGAMSVRVKARALEPGRSGERIAFQLVDSSKSFRARVDGPSRAITDTGGESGAAAANESAIGVQHAADGTSAAPERTGTLAKVDSKSGKRQPPSVRELARAAAKEADRRRNLYLDLSDRRIAPAGASLGIDLPESVRSGVFNVTRGVPKSPPQGATGHPGPKNQPSENHE